MSSSFKRVLTDEAHQSLVASSTAPQSTSDDLAARLRSVGPRVRKNVTEGYTSPPPSFTKSNSTGTIFRSAHDTLREIYPPSNTNSIPLVSEKKRARPQGDQGYDSDGGADKDRDAEMGSVNQDSDEQGVSIIMSPDAKSLNRPMKALRKPRRAMLATRSLPTSAFVFGEIRTNNEPTMISVEEEEDWSAGNFVTQGFQTSTQNEPRSFEPMFCLDPPIY